MSENIKRASVNDAKIIGEVFDLYRVFYKQESNISVAQQYITERLSKNGSVIFFAEEKESTLGKSVSFENDRLSLAAMLFIKDQIVEMSKMGDGLSISLDDLLYD